MLKVALIIIALRILAAPHGFFFGLNLAAVSFILQSGYLFGRIFFGIGGFDIDIGCTAVVRQPVARRGGRNSRGRRFGRTCIRRFDHGLRQVCGITSHPGTGLFPFGHHFRLLFFHDFRQRHAAEYRDIQRQQRKKQPFHSCPTQLNRP